MHSFKSLWSRERALLRATLNTGFELYQIMSGSLTTLRPRLIGGLQLGRRSRTSLQSYRNNFPPTVIVHFTSKTLFAWKVLERVNGELERMSDCAST